MYKRQALLVAIQAFEGAIVLVSHDRNMVSVLCDELLLVNDGQVRPFDGDLDDYAQWLRQWRTEKARAVTAAGRAAVAAPVAAAVMPSPEQAPVSVARKVVRSADVRALQQALAKAEARVATHQQRLGEIAASLADSAVYEPGQADALQRLLTEQATLQAALEEDEARWLALGEELDALTG